jgi:hypothetical protein
MRSTSGTRKLNAAVAVACFVAYATLAFAQEKKTDEDKHADPDTGESTVEEKTLGILPQPFQQYGIKFAATYIGEVLGSTTGGVNSKTGQGRRCRTFSTISRWRRPSTRIENKPVVG